MNKFLLWVSKCIAWSVLLSISCVMLCRRAEAGETGTLIIDVHVLLVSSLASDPGLAGNWINGYWITNIQTGKSFGGLVTNNNGLVMLEVPEGIYCVDNLISGGTSLNFDYCHEPFFRVSGGKTNNAGRWRFGVVTQDNQFKLFGSMEDLPGVLRAAKVRYPEKFE